MSSVKTSPQPSEPSSASSPESSVQFQTQKRKGGRKPVYATQEERKMRNRAAQAGEIMPGLNMDITIGHIAKVVIYL